MIVSRDDPAALDILAKPIEMEPALQSVVDAVTGARVKLVHTDVRGSVLGDPQRTKQVLRHLVSNATLHGGGEISITGRPMGRIYELRVHDDGDQLGDEDLEKVFEAFYRLPSSETKAGRGVGLTVSKILAVAMGGDLRLESASHGNTAVLTLRALPTSGGQPMAEAYALKNRAPQST
jgi:signal transduction histidine kinase